MRVQVDLDNPKFCDGCPFKNMKCHLGYWSPAEGIDLIKKGKMTRPLKCKEENGL